MAHRAHDFCLCFSESLMIFFMRDNCGPIEMIKRTSICLKIRKKKLQFVRSARQRMEDAQVGDRELQATTERINVREPLR